MSRQSQLAPGGRHYVITSGFSACRLAKPSASRKETDHATHARDHSSISITAVKDSVAQRIVLFQTVFVTRLRGRTKRGLKVGRSRALRISAATCASAFLVIALSQWLDLGIEMIGLLTILLFGAATFVVGNRGY